MEKEKQKVAEKKKPKIVLNAAIKVKAKEKTSCTVYNCALDVMGKKEEFRYLLSIWNRLILNYY